MDHHYLVETLKRALNNNVQFTRSSLPGQFSWPTFLPKPINLPRDIRDELLSHFRGDDRLSDFDHKLFNRGVGSGLVTIDMLAEWIVAKAIERGPEQAVHTLEQFMASPFTAGYEILALSGVEITRRHRIISDIEIIPFSELPPSFEKDSLDPQPLPVNLLASLGLNPLTYVSSQQVPPKAALIRPIKISPKSFSAAGEAVRPLRWDMQLYQVYDCLTLIGPSAPFPRGHWTEVDQDVPCYGWLGGGHSSLIYDVVTGNAYTYSEDDLTEMSILVEQFLALKPSMRDNLRIPVTRMNQAIRRREITDKAIDLGIALESLLLRDRGPDDPISLPFRLRGAWLLGHDEGTRSQFFIKFKSLYNLRSVAVHTGKVTSTVKVTGRGKINTKNLLDEGIEICGQAIRKIISDQAFPDWDKLVLGA